MCMSKSSPAPAPVRKTVAPVAPVEEVEPMEIGGDEKDEDQVFTQRKTRRKLLIGLGKTEGSSGLGIPQ